MPTAPYDPDAEDEEAIEVPAIDTLIEEILHGNDGLASLHRRRPRSS